MPVRPVFRCQFCGERPDAQTQVELERQQQDMFFGQYVDAARWLIWHGRGPLGPKRYACGAHRGELTAYLRFHYASVGYQVWKMGPYPRPRRSAGNAGAAHMSRMGGSGFAA